ncbi:MAG: BtrH N-terminal domain-containing protein [Gemmatimonadota bacterium]
MIPHLSGRIPATTALRIQLQHAGVEYSEPLLFLLAGGVGAGVFSFVYEKEDVATLFLAGRHLWADDQAYLTAAAKRLGHRVVVKETTSAKAADDQLRAALDEGHPVIAWVDLAHLPYRAAPARLSGGGYHVLTVYSIDGDSALVGDLAPKPVSIPLRDLGIARQRIAKQRNRLLWLERPAGKSAGKPPTRQALVDEAIAACAGTLNKAKMVNFRLDAFQELADRMAGSNKESWALMFPPGGRMWTALTSLHDCITNYFTGGGLCRIIFAEGLREAGLPRAADLYAELGTQWNRTAALALPDINSVCMEARDLLNRKAALTGGGGSVREIRACWERLDRLTAEARKKFPLPAAEAAALRGELAHQMRDLFVRETAALAALTR